jgi:hypothetical protein
VQNTNILDGYLDRVECAKQLDVTVRTLERWESLREGPPITKIGRKSVYSIASLRKWLESCERVMVRARRKVA